MQVLLHLQLALEGLANRVADHFLHVGRSDLVCGERLGQDLLREGLIDAAAGDLVCLFPAGGDFEPAQMLAEIGLGLANGGGDGVDRRPALRERHERLHPVDGRGRDFILLEDLLALGALTDRLADAVDRHGLEVGIVQPLADLDQFVFDVLTGQGDPVLEVHLHAGSAGELDVVLRVAAGEEHRQAADDQNAGDDVEPFPHAHPVDVRHAEQPQHDEAVLDDPLGDQEVEDDPGHEDGGEHARADAEHQDDGEAFDVLAGHIVQDGRGEDRRQVRVEDRAESAAIAVSDGGRQSDAAFLLLANSLEDQHVGVDAHADRQDQAGDAGQGERRSQGGHDGQREQQVQQQRHIGDGAADRVVRQHEGGDDDQADDARTDALVEVVGADGRTDHPRGDGLLDQSGGQRAGVELVHHVGDLRLAEAAGDDAPFVNAAFGDVGGRDGDVVQEDGQRAAGVLAGDAVEEVAALGVQGEADGAAADVVGSGVGVFELPLASARAVQHRLIRLIAGQDVELLAELADDRASDLPLLDFFDLDPFVPTVRGGLGAFVLQIGQIPLDLGLAELAAVHGGEDAEFEDAGAFEHALQVGRIVEPSTEGPIALVGGDHSLDLVLAVGESRLEVRDPLGLLRRVGDVQHGGDSLLGEIELIQLPAGLLVPFVETALGREPVEDRALLFIGPDVTGQGPELGVGTEEIGQLLAEGLVGQAGPLSAVGLGPLQIDARRGERRAESLDLGREGVSPILQLLSLVVDGGQLIESAQAVGVALGELGDLLGSFLRRHLQRPQDDGRVDVLFQQIVQRRQVGVPLGLRFLAGQGHLDLEPRVAQGAPDEVLDVGRVDTPAQHRDHPLSHVLLLGAAEALGVDGVDETRSAGQIDARFQRLAGGVQGNDGGDYQNEDQNDLRRQIPAHISFLSKVLFMIDDWLPSPSTQGSHKRRPFRSAGRRGESSGKWPTETQIVIPCPLARGSC